MTLMFGNTPVPFTASWSDEESFYVGRCQYARTRAIMQRESAGHGTPLFGKPHSVRQRKAMALELCDLCGRPLKLKTKVSLSHARPQPHGAEGWVILQVEPLLHVQCAATCIRYCPSLRRDISAGTLMVRQVNRHRVQFAVMSEEYVETIAGERVKAIGHAKVELLRWIDRDQGWLSDKTSGTATAEAGP